MMEMGVGVGCNFTRLKISVGGGGHKRCAASVFSLRGLVEVALLFE